MAKMQLELGGKYTAGQAFQKASDDVKKFGKENKDAIKAGTDTLKELENGFGNDLGNAIGKAKGLVQGFSSGGLWGGIAAVAGIAIGAVVDWFKQAKENAKAFANTCGEYLTESIKKIGNTFSKTKEEIRAAKQEAEDFAAIAQGAVVNSANAQVHQLHIETLQKITDNMTDAARKVLEADEALAAAKIKQEAVAKSVAISTEEQAKNVKRAEEELALAENRLSEIQAEKCSLSKHENEVIKNYANLKAQEADIIYRWKDNAVTKDYAERNLARIQKELAELYEDNKGTIDANKSAIEAVTKAEDDVASASRALEHEKRMSTVAEQKLKDQVIAAERAVIDATQARKDAIKAEQEYTQKTKEAAEKEAKRQKEKDEAEAKKKKVEEDAEKAKLKEIRLKILKEEYETKDIEITKECYRLKVSEARYLSAYHKLREEGYTQEQAMQKLQKMFNEQLKYENRLREEIKEKKLEEKEFLKKYTEMLNKGISEADAYAQVQRDLNEALKKRKEAEEKAVQMSDETGKSGSQLKKDKNTIQVSLSSSAMGDIGEKVESKLSFKDWQRKMRDEQRKGRDEKNNMRIDQAKMTKALKGEMPEEEARQWMEYAKKKYTPDQMRELGRLAMNKELLSKSEQKQQKKAIEQMARDIALALATK